MPVLLVLGVGAALLPVPPVEEVYHFKDVPDAVNAEAVAPIHKFTGLVTVGAEGAAVMFTTIEALSLSQPVVAFVWLT